MKYKIGDKVIYIKKSNNYTWKLNKNELYTITNRAFDKSGDKEYYAVENKKKDIRQSWYFKDDFISLEEARKLKLKKLNDIV